MKMTNQNYQYKTIWMVLMVILTGNFEDNQDNIYVNIDYIIKF